jgi:hypothetical protein
MIEPSKSKLWWFAGLFLRLLLVSFLSLILSFVSWGTFMTLGFNNRISWGLIVISNVAVFAWAIYFRFPFFQSCTNRQRFLISTVIAVPTVFLTYYGVIALLTAAIDFASTSDKRTESVTLPSGEVLVNHTYYESGWDGGDRFNKLFLKNPAKRTSEYVGDLHYDDAEANTPSLFAQFPHPQEFTYRNKKVLVIGPYLCKRINSPKAPYWDITTINWENEKLGLLDNDARAYLKSFLPTNDITSNQGSVRFDFDSLDLTNNILTLKKQMPKAGENWDEFPPYLVFSALGYNHDSIYTFPSKFDIARTKAKNAPLWNKP